MKNRPREQTDSALARKLSQCLELEPEDLARIGEFEGQAEAVAAGEDLVVENQPFHRAGVLVEGWCLKYKLLSDGRRQVVNFVLPGGFIGLHANVFETADHSVSTLSRCRVSRFDPQLVTKTFAERPLLAAAIVWDNAREEAVLMEHLASLGRRSADDRFAHLMFELAKQLTRRDLVGEERILLPIPQAVIADTLGLSLVHVSRTMSRLRREGLIETSPPRGIALSDLNGLARVCGYADPSLRPAPLPERTRKSIGA